MSVQQPESCGGTGAGPAARSHAPADAPRGSREEIATRAYAAMRYLVLDQGDGRREVAETLGMSFVRAKALRRLAIEPLRMSELAASMGTDKPYATLVVDDLEARGLVVRTVDPSDRRAKIVAVTEAGREAAATADAILSRPAPGLARLDDEELATLARLVGKAAADDDEHSPELRMRDRM